MRYVIGLQTKEMLRQAVTSSCSQDTNGALTGPYSEFASKDIPSIIENLSCRENSLTFLEAAQLVLTSEEVQGGISMPSCVI